MSVETRTVHSIRGISSPPLEVTVSASDDPNVIWLGGVTQSNHTKVALTTEFAREVARVLLLVAGPESREQAVLMGATHLKMPPVIVVNSKEHEAVRRLYQDAAAMRAQLVRAWSAVRDTAHRYISGPDTEGRCYLVDEKNHAELMNSVESACKLMDTAYALCTEILNQ